MIRWRLQALLDERQMTPYHLSKVTGLDTRLIYKLVKADRVATFTATTIERLCWGLEIEPGDLFEFVRDRDPRVFGDEV